MRPEDVDTHRRLVGVAAEAAAAAESFEEERSTPPEESEGSEELDPTKRFDLLWKTLLTLVPDEGLESGYRDGEVLDVRTPFALVVVGEDQEKYGLVFDLNRDRHGQQRVHAEWHHWGNGSGSATSSGYVRNEYLIRDRLEGTTPGDEFLVQLANLETSLVTYLDSRKIILGPV